MKPLIALILASFVFGQGPANVLLVVNDNSSVSRSIGEYYARKRSIPQQNICRIRTTTDEEIPRTIYNGIAESVSACLKGGLAESILYIVTTLGVPLKISGSAGTTAGLPPHDPIWRRYRHYR